MNRGHSARAAAAALGLALALIGSRVQGVRGDPAEPPADAPEDADYDVERPDSIGDGDIEVGLGVVANDGRHSTQRRRALFRSDSLGGAVRDGAGDDLAGSSLEGAAAGGRFGLGRSMPVWGRGLVLGDPREPWGWRERGTQRRSAGDVLWYRAGRGSHVGAWAGTAGRKQPALGLDAGARGANGGVVFDRRGISNASVWASRESGGSGGGAEFASDRRGRWRAETFAQRRDGSARLGGWVRAGHEAYRGAGDPRRAGPPLAVSARADVPLAHGTRLGLLGAWWRFAPGVPGARATLEVQQALPHHAGVVAGFEQQHGTRRDPAVVGRPAPEARFRQGAWAEWHGGAGPVSLAWRHEFWGERRWVRGEVRAVSTARIGVESPAGVGVRITYAAFRAVSGEHVYLPELEADRLVLRALAGDGERARVELRGPFAGGMVEAALNRTFVPPRAPRMQWTVEWTRRSRLRREP